MEIYEVVGYRRVNFTDDKTKNVVDGYTLFLQRTPDAESKITGLECCKQFISAQYVSYVPQVGDTIRLIYNRYGKIGAVETV